MKILVTGSAGFIGFHLVEALASTENTIVGVDNINKYYDSSLKYARLEESGINKRDIEWYKEVKSSKYINYKFIRLNLEDKAQLLALCAREQFDIIIHLAAQAGVRYSVENPDIYVQSNVVGFLNILEVSRYFKIKHLIYASSSSVYGLNEKMPFSINQNVDHPVSLYAATKKANELMAHTYSHLYNLPTTGLRFFTVYGPWGRPDMAYFLFADSISKGKNIKVFNHGKMKRDFTYVDDVIKGIINILDCPAKPSFEWCGEKPEPSTSKAPYKIYNIGNNNPIELISFIKEIEKNMEETAKMEMLDIQAGDLPETWADIDESTNQFNYKPDTSIETGIYNFIKWYKKYYKIETVVEEF
ncbi:NAD-dependent epimerase [Spirosoma oryzicola]|uniref:NAD-dependent epimerase n=1 Tax=Spirosoma oryzicola TaxID=2898794 RepID=UPI001E374153|nr:NAD-dependent epimerase [Spirosoma oryzicola]UHG93157.1 NAD-dependent epimerase [Spirosoma oryzicola]